MASLQQIAAVMQKHGEPMTLTRGASSVTVYAKAFRQQGSDLTGDIQQGQRTVKFSDSEIAAAGWPGPPRKPDTLTTAAGLVFVIQDVDTRAEGPTVLMHLCTVKGDA